jgi:hypothetical protein
MTALGIALNLGIFAVLYALDTAAARRRKATR